MKQCCKDYLMEQFGDEDVIKEIYAEYVKSVQEKLPELEAALTAENWTMLDSLAHAVRAMPWPPETPIRPTSPSPSGPRRKCRTGRTPVPFSGN